MSQLRNILLAPYNFFFGEDGVFGSSSGSNQQSTQSMYYGLPAVAFAILGLLFLIVGELSAGKTLVKRYKEDVEEITKEKNTIKTDLAQKLKIASATRNDDDTMASDISKLHDQMSQKLNSEQILLRKLSSLAPDEPKYFFELALTYLTKSNLELTLAQSATTEKEQQARLAESLAQKNQGMAIMSLIAPLDKPGYLQAHLFLARAALNSDVKSAKQRNAKLRLANRHLDNALIREQENENALTWKIKILQSTGQLKEAKKHLETLFASDPFVYPQICKINTRLGVAEKNAEVLNSAQQRLKDQIATMSGSLDGRTKHVTYLVDCLRSLGKLDEADRRVKSEMSRFPEDEGMQRWGGRLLAMSQRLRYLKGGELNPENADELIGYLREGHRLDPNNVNILNAIVALPRTELPGADEISNEIYRPGPKAPASVESILGTLALKKGDYLEATKRFAKALSKEPSNAEYLNNLSYVYLTRPEPDPGEALKLVDRAIRNVRSGTFSTRHLSNFYDTKGRALLELGKTNEAKGDQQLANSQYAAAAAKLLAALALIKEPDGGWGSDRDKKRADDRRLEITGKIVECYEASGQTQQVSVWRDQVKQLEAEDVSETP